MQPAALPCRVLLALILVLDFQAKAGIQRAENKIPGLINNLRSEKPAVRMQALRELARMGPGAWRAIPQLLEALADPDPAVASQAGRVLVQIGPNALPGIEKALDSRNAQARCLALSVLQDGSWDEKITVSILIKALNSRWTDVRRKVAYELNGKGDSAAVIPLIRVVRTDSDRWVRREAIRALASLHAEGAPAIPALIELIEKEAGLVDAPCLLSVEAAGALASIREKALPSLLALVKDPKKRADVRSLAITSLTWMSRDQSEKMCTVVPVAVSLLREHDADLRWRSTLLLGHLGRTAQGALPALAESLQQGSPKEQVAAAEAIYLISGKIESSLPVLLGALHSRDPIARSSAAAVIGRVGAAARSAIPSLINACKDKETMVRLQAVQALGSMGPLPGLAIRAIQGCMHDESQSVRLAAGQVLKNEPDPRKHRRK